MAQRVGDDDSTDWDRLAHCLEGGEENCRVEQPVEQAEHQQRRKVIGGERLLTRDVLPAQMPDRPECTGHELPATEDGCDEDGGRDREHGIPRLSSEPVAAGGETACGEEHERRDTQQARDQKRENGNGPLDRVSPQLLVPVDRRDRLPTWYGVEHRDADHREREEGSERDGDRAELQQDTDQHRVAGKREELGGNGHGNPAGLRAPDFRK